jgi:crotonobetainyl-CoA:carnitine CoA-transferase CaiB-like acyl-CoA transferase
MAGNALTRSYLTADGRDLYLMCLQAGKYWGPLCKAIGRPELIDDPRFATHEDLMANGLEAGTILEEVFGAEPVDVWRERLEDFVGQWTVVQNTLEAAADPQTIANGYLQDCVNANGTPFKLVAAPVQFDEEPATPGRAPELSEHGDEILQELGLDWDAIIDLKVRGVVA